MNESVPPKAATGKPVYFEDFEVGQTRAFGAYAVTEAEVVAFGRQFDPQAFHIDPDAAADTVFGGLIASGWHTCGMMMRMVCDDGLPRTAVLASPGFENLKWLRPVRPGDVLSVRSVVAEKIESKSKPDRGIIKIANTVLNQTGEAVMTITNIAFYRRRPAPAAEG